MSQFVGFEEGWIEKGWTRKQMRERIEELGLTTEGQVCSLLPYELNFMQDPNANAEILDVIEKSEKTGDNQYAKPMLSKLWTPGETITISFTGSANLIEIAKKYIMQDLQPHVSMKFQFVASGGRIVVVFAPMQSGEIYI